MNKNNKLFKRSTAPMNFKPRKGEIANNMTTQNTMAQLEIWSLGFENRAYAVSDVLYLFTIKSTLSTQTATRKLCV